MSTWARKPGQTPGQAQADAKQSSAYNYTPNRQPAQANPYGPPAQTGQAQPQASPYSTATPYGQPAMNMQQWGTPTSSTTVYSSGGNTSPFGNYAPQPQAAPFQASWGSPFGGQPTQQPNFAQRDAFIQSILNQQVPYMTGQQQGPIQYDFTAALANANQMVNNGFQNPFNFGQAAQPGIRAPITPNAAPLSRYEQELGRIRDQGSGSTMTAGRANSDAEQDLANALRRGMTERDRAFRGSEMSPPAPRPQAASPTQAPGPANQQSVIEQTLRRLQDARQAAELSTRRAPAPFVPSAPIGATARAPAPPPPAAAPQAGRYGLPLAPGQAGRNAPAMFYAGGQLYENSNWTNPLSMTQRQLDEVRKRQGVRP